MHSDMRMVCFHVRVCSLIKRCWKTGSKADAQVCYLFCAFDFVGFV